MSDTPEARLARWTERDAAIGVAAERDQLREQLVGRNREIADLRERLNHLTISVGQLGFERQKLIGLVDAGRRPSPSRRAYLWLRHAVGRQLRR